MPTLEKLTNITDIKNESTDKFQQSPEKLALAMTIQQLFKGAYEAKDQMDLMDKWATFDDYVHSIQNEPNSEEQPGMVTNIIKSAIDGQLSDIMDKPFNTSALGREPGDHMFAEDVQNAMDFVLDKNLFKTKLNLSEHDRLELGTSVIKVMTDMEALNKRGLPTIEVVSPANFFPDPKWSASYLLQDCEFIIHAVPKPLSWIRRNFKDGMHVKRSVTWIYDPTLDIDTTKTDEVTVQTSQKALLIECYMKDENGDIFCVHVANDIILEDSRENDIIGTKLQRRNLFPFEVIICYPLRGTGWGMGDVEYLMPTQDLINDLDDQIIMASRLMGNPQMAVILSRAGKGFDMRKWTNAPGLRVPFRETGAFEPIPGIPVSRDVVERREKAFQEADIVSGRSDVNRGETPGSVTAASAIRALQEAGQKTVVHKAEMMKQGWSNVLHLLYDEMITHWDEGMWIRINGDKPDFTFFDPSQLKQAPIMVPNISAGDGEDSLKQLMGDPQPIMDADNQPMMHPQIPMTDGQGMQMTDETGPMFHPQQPMMAPPQPMTREAEFDLKLNLGNGLPTDKAFIYQSIVELAALNIGGQPVISWQEIRSYLRTEVGLPLEPDDAVLQQSMLQNAPPMDPSVPMIKGVPSNEPVAS